MSEKDFELKTTKDENGNVVRAEYVKKSGKKVKPNPKDDE